MKMTQDDYNKLENDIKIVLSQHPTFYKDACKLGWSETRMRWALYHQVNSVKTEWKYKHLYNYLNDNHIDTALRNITGLKNK